MGELNVHKSILLSMFTLSMDTAMITNMQMEELRMACMEILLFA
jgi:hypothetical protein